MESLLWCPVFSPIFHSVVLFLVARSCMTLCNPKDSSPPGSSVPGDSPGKTTGMGCHALLHRIFPTQGLNPGLPHHRWILYWLSHQGSPRILEWVAYPFSRGSSWPRNQTRVSCIAGRFFTIFTLKLSCISLHFSTLTTLYYNIVFPVLSLWREFEILFKFYLFIFNWKLIALQNCIDFCQTSALFCFVLFVLFLNCAGSFFFFFIYFY